MEIRPLTTADLSMLVEIDGTIESTHYLHLGRSEDEDADELAVKWSLERRELSETLIEPNRIDQGELTFTYKQIVSGIEEGTGLAVVRDGDVIATLLTIERPATDTVELVDVRVDYDLRREGFAQGLLFALMTQLRERPDKPRAVHAAVAASNDPMHGLLRRCGFELAGFDERRQSNFDLVKEAATMLWYLPLV